MEKRLKKVTKSTVETQILAKEIAKKLPSGTVLALYGDLGSGKTTFVQGLAEELGITQRIISPTFLIMRTYNLKEKEKKFYHIDLYRIENDHDIEELGIEEIMKGENNIVVIEWPEKLGKFLPKNSKKIYFSYLSDQEREIVYE